MSKLTENMKNNTFPKALLKKISFALVICMMFSLCGCNKEIENTKISESVTVTESAATTAGTTETRSPESAESTVSSETTEITATADPEVIQDIVEEMVIDYGTYGSDADDRIDSLLEDLYVTDKTAGEKWTKIMDMWRSPNLGEPLNYDVLPDGLPDTDELCIVVLGFQLNPDGSMKNELVNRLTVALESAQTYPKAYIVFKGGGTYQVTITSQRVSFCLLRRRYYVQALREKRNLKLYQMLHGTLRQELFQSCSRLAH